MLRPYSGSRSRDFVTQRVARGRCGFSLIELIVVLAVVTILTSLLMPALTRLRENVHKVVCSSNLRQIAIATSMYSRDHYDQLPPTANLSQSDGVWEPHELMAARMPRSSQEGSWDGFGILYHLQYCGSHECFYCPSHTGQHPISRYAQDWFSDSDSLIYTNYHYSGDRDWETGMRRFMFRPASLIIATDGLRTADDVNHRFGTNAAYGDGSVRWRTELVGLIDILPSNDDPGGIVVDPIDEKYIEIWSILEGK
ncbi:MAG: type II secretion system protein [Phycisphaerales bacterium]|nr:MAG: type II secretion system protein [Phycisphaerales bacterium]